MSKLYLVLVIIGLSLYAQAQYCYVTCRDNRSVVVIDVLTMSVVDTFDPNGDGPTGIEIDRFGDYGYVCLKDYDELGVVDLSDYSSNAPSANDDPWDIVITPDDSHVFITNITQNQVTVFNTLTQNITTAVPVGLQPTMMEITANGDRVFVSNKLSDTVTVISTNTYVIVEEIPIGRGPDGMKLTDDGSHIYVALEDDDSLAVINTITHQVEKKIYACDRPLHLTISPDEEFAYVSCEDAWEVAVIDLGPDTVVTNIPVGGEPRQLEYMSNGQVWVACRDADRVDVISTTTNTVVNSIPVLGSPSFLAVGPGGPTGRHAFAKPSFSLNVSPNPVTEESVIEFDLPVEGLIKIEIVDVKGAVIRSIEERYYASGSHQVALGANKLMPGVYILRVKLGESMEKKKFIIH